MSALTPEDATALAMLKVGYGIGASPKQHGPYECFDFRVSFTLEGACVALADLSAPRRVYLHDPARVIVALCEVQSLAPDPRRILVGREGSPVIYVRGLGEDDLTRAADIWFAAGADEVSYDPEGTMRAWWDS